MIVPRPAGLDKSSTPGSALVAPGRVRFAQELAVGVSMHVLGVSAVTFVRTIRS